MFGDAKASDAMGPAEEIPEAEVEQEMAPKRVPPDPGRPAETEICEHYVDHWPYRSWCEHCVSGRGTGEQHREGSGSSIHIVAFDYLLVTDRGVQRRDDLEGDEEKTSLIKILVVKDLKSKAIFAHVVPQNGVDADGYAVVRLIEDVKWLGYTKILRKTDNEKAMGKLLHDSLRRIKTEVLDVKQIG